jgi:hypothetical protein
MVFDTHFKQGGVSMHSVLQKSAISRFANPEGKALSSTQIEHSLVSSPNI